MARPKLVIDGELVRSMAEIQCTQEEIAHVVGCSVDTLSRRGFAEIIKKAAEGGKSSLRRQQWAKAMDGNSTMLIWLGKQYLGQTDKMQSDVRNTSLDALLDEAEASDGTSVPA